MAAFYSYAYPEPEGFRNAPLTARAYYDATLDRRFDRKIGCCTDLHEERAGRIHPHHLAVALELPRRHCPAGEAAAQACVAEQVARVLGSAVALQIGGRSGRREALDARPDRHGDHVFLQPFVVADTRVTPGRKNVDEAVVGDHLQSDLRISGEEGRNDRRQCQARSADRDIQP